MESNSLHIIWAACKKHDRKAQVALYEYYSKKMLAVCMRYANTTLEAEDILQNGFVKIFTKHHLYDGTGSLEGWIKRIMINVAIETYRRNSSRITESIDQLESLQISSDIGTDQTAYKDLIALIQQLPTGYRTVFNLYAIEGYSHKEIAELLEISEGNSKSQLSRARQWLQHKLVNVKQ